MVPHAPPVASAAAKACSTQRNFVRAFSGLSRGCSGDGMPRVPAHATHRSPPLPAHTLTKRGLVGQERVGSPHGQCARAFPLDKGDELLQLSRLDQLPPARCRRFGRRGVDELLEHAVGQAEGARRGAGSHRVHARDRAARVADAVVLLQEEEVSRWWCRTSRALGQQLGTPRPRDLLGGEEQADRHARLRHLHPGVWRDCWPHLASPRANGRRREAQLRRTMESSSGSSPNTSANPQSGGRPSR
eukprot:scaffold5440_cov88-Isochrysis_galbana.AAC.2